MTIKIDRIDGQYVARCAFNERFVLKKAGFEFIGKKWVTSEDDVAQSLYKFTIDNARQRLDNINEIKKKLVEASFADDYDGDLLCPEGLAYLPFQKAGIDFALKRKDVLIGDSPGVGKTIQAIGVINNDVSIKKSLLVVPASLKINWKRECEKWLCDKSLKIEIPYSKAETYIDDEGAKRSKTVHHWPSEADVVIVNYDQLETYHDKIRERVWDLLVCDEAHVLKNAKSQKCKQVFGYIGKKKSEKLIAIKANKRIFLTGTPILNKPIDLFVLASECAPDTFGSYIKYVTRYCDAYKTTWGLDVSGASNLEEFQEKLRSTFMIRRMKADVLKELPEKRRAVVILPQDGLSKIVKKERQSFFDNMKALSIINGDSVEKDYEDISTELLNELMASVGDNITNFDNLDLEEYMKTHFEAIAYAREEIGLAKVKMVVEYAKNLLDSTDKVVIFAVHKKVVSEIRKYFNNAAVVVGGMSSDAKQSEVDRFRNDPDCNVIILNLDAGAVGWTLVEANHLIMAELGFVPPILEQAEDRIYRIGQKNAVNIWYLIVDGSIEASLIEIFIKKLEIIDKALNRQIVTEE